MKTLILLIITICSLTACSSLPESREPAQVKVETIDFETLVKNSQNQPKVKPEKQVQKFYFKNLKFPSQVNKSNK